MVGVCRREKVLTHRPYVTSCAIRHTGVRLGRRAGAGGAVRFHACSLSANAYMQAKDSCPNQPSMDGMRSDTAFNTTTPTKKTGGVEPGDPCAGAGDGSGARLQGRQGEYEYVASSLVLLSILPACMHTQDLLSVSAAAADLFYTGGQTTTKQAEVAGMEAMLARLKAFSGRIDALETAHECVLYLLAPFSPLRGGSQHSFPHYNAAHI